MRFEITVGHGRVRLRTTPRGALATVSPDYEVELIPVTEDLFAAMFPGSARWTWLYFSALTDGRPYLHDGARATPIFG